MLKTFRQDKGEKNGGKQGKQRAMQLVYAHRFDRVFNSLFNISTVLIEVYNFWCKNYLNQNENIEKFGFPKGALHPLAWGLENNVPPTNTPANTSAKLKIHSHLYMKILAFHSLICYNIYILIIVGPFMPS